MHHPADHTYSYAEEVKKYRTRVVGVPRAEVRPRIPSLYSNVPVSVWATTRLLVGPATPGVTWLPTIHVRPPSPLSTLTRDATHAAPSHTHASHTLRIRYAHARRSLRTPPPHTYASLTALTALTALLLPSPTSHTSLTAPSLPPPPLPHSRISAATRTTPPTRPASPSSTRPSAPSPRTSSSSPTSRGSPWTSSRASSRASPRSSRCL